MAETSLRLLVQELRHLTADRGDHSDDELLRRYTESRDALAFEILVWRHAAVVLGVCRRVLRHDQDAEDVFQATFLALARQAHAIRHKAALSGWLYTVACRLAKAVQARRVERPSDDLADVAARVPRDSDSDELRGVLDDEVNRLPAHYRQAFVLCYLEGLTNTEAARELGCAKGTIDSRLAWARNRLRKRLTQRGIGLSTVLAALGTQTPSALGATPPTAELVQQIVRQIDGARTAPGAVRAVDPRIETLIGEVMTRTSTKWLTAASVCALVLALAGLGWATSGNPPPPPEPPRVTSTVRAPDGGAPAADGPKPLEQAPAPREAVKTHPFSFSVSVLSPGGTPVKNAKLYFITESVLKRFESLDGRFSFKDEPIPVHDDFYVKVPTGWFRLVATSPEFGFVWGASHRFITRPCKRWEMTLPGDVYLRDHSFSLSFKEPVPCEGRIADETGKPLANTVVRVQSCEFVTPEENPGFGWVVGDPFVPENREDPAITAKTDKDGRFRLLLPKESKTTIRIEHPDYAPVAGFVDCSAARKKLGPENVSDTTVSPIWDVPLEVKLVKPRTVAVRVLDEADKQPLAGIRLKAYRAPLTDSPLAEGVSDAKGNVIFRLPPGRVWLWGTTGGKSIGPKYYPSNERLIVGTNSEQTHTFLMKHGRLLKIEVVDADTGKGIPNCSFAQMLANDPINAFDLGRTSASGELETLASRSHGKFRVEMSRVEGYKVIEAPTDWIEAEHGEPIKLRFRLRPDDRKGTDTEIRP